MIYYCHNCGRYIIEEDLLEIEKFNSLKMVCPKCKDNNFEDRSKIMYNEESLKKILNNLEERLENISNISSKVINYLYTEIDPSKINKVKEKIKKLK